MKTYRWHKDGWEIKRGQPIKEPRCHCERCEWRLFVLAGLAAVALLGQEERKA
jgi:hypothetical protein